jgi:hypothetical protein
MRLRGDFTDVDCYPAVLVPLNLFAVEFIFRVGGLARTYRPGDCLDGFVSLVNPSVSFHRGVGAGTWGCVDDGKGLDADLALRAIDGCDRVDLELEQGGALARVRGEA